MLVIGLGHESRVGKDTLANYLVDTRGITSPRNCDVRRYAFADPLKLEVVEAVNVLTQSGYYQLGNVAKFQCRCSTPQLALRALCDAAGVPYEEDPLMDDPLLPWGKQRRLLQWWGTEFRRTEHPDYWIVKAHRRLDEDNPAVAIFADLRFPNEFNYIHSVGGVCIHLVREGVPKNTDRHPSERLLDGWPFDYTISASSVVSLQLQGLRLFDQLIMGWR